VSKELQQYYEAVSFEYEKLGNLLDKVSKFYQSIIKEDRAESEYFRVGFYGLDFPSFLQVQFLQQLHTYGISYL